MQECPQFQSLLGTTWEPHFPLILFRGGTQKQPTTTTTTIKKAPSPTPPKHRRLHILASSFHTTCRRPPFSFFEGADAYTDPETHRGRLFAPLPANPFWWAFLLPLLSISLSLAYTHSSFSSSLALPKGAQVASRRQRTCLQKESYAQDFPSLLWWRWWLGRSLFWNSWCALRVFFHVFFPPFTPHCAHKHTQREKRALQETHAPGQLKEEAQITQPCNKHTTATKRALGV